MKSHPGASFPACIYLVFAFAAVFVVRGAYSQEQDQQDLDELAISLPENAAWRFVSANEKPNNGFFRLKYSHDGQLLAARTKDNVVEVRDTNSKKMIFDIGEHKSKIEFIDFSRDSKFLLIVDAGANRVSIWNARTGTLEKEFECDPVHARFFVSKSDQVSESILILEQDQLSEYSWPDAKRIRIQKLTDPSDTIRRFVLDRGRFVIENQRVNNKEVYLTKLVDLRLGVTRILQGPPNAPRRLLASRDNQWLAAIYRQKNTIRIWNLNEPALSSYELHGHRSVVESFSFSPDSRFFASSSADKTVIVWDLLTREPITRIFDHDERVTAVAYGRNAMTLATAANGPDDSTAIVWSLEKMIFSQTGKMLEPNELGTAWRGLGNSNPVVALNIVNDMRHSPASVFFWMEHEIGLPMSNSHCEISKWISELDASKYHVREDATQKLIEARGPSERLLLEAYDAAPSSEVRYRISRILQHAVSRPKINVAELRRLRRSIFVLELIGQNKEHFQPAKELLKRIAENHPHIDVSRDAAASLNRIEALAMQTNQRRSVDPVQEKFPN